MLGLVATKTWVAINHIDFWVNNIMFRDGKNELEGLKLIDFQTAVIGSPIDDLPYFLFTTVNS